MIVASMSPEEIHHEITRDYESVVPKAMATLKILLYEKRRLKPPYGFRNVLFTTRHRNEWRLLYNLDAKLVLPCCYLKSWDKFGVVAYKVQENHEDGADDYFVIKYNTHFFQRYNERLALGLSDPAKHIAHFFRYSQDFYLGRSELFEDGTRSIYLVFKEGVGIGWQDDDKRTRHIKTFISNKSFPKNFTDILDAIKSGECKNEYFNFREENARNKMW